MIGDPSGKSNERNLMTQNDVDENVDKFKMQFEYLNGNYEAKLSNLGIDVESLPKITYVDNKQFYEGMSAIEFLRGVGKHFRMGTMMSRESVKTRLTTDDLSLGMSFTEFSYQLL